MQPSSAAPAGVVVHLPLSGGRQLAVWQPTGSNQIALHVAGYDATDSIGGTSVTDRNPKNGGLVRRDIFTSSAALDQHLQITYGYLLSQITAKLRAAGRTSPTPRWYSDALTGTQRPAERTTDLHFGGDLVAVSKALGRAAPCRAVRVAGLPFATADLISDQTAEGASHSVTCAYSTDARDPASAPRFVTITAFPRHSRSAQDVLDHVQGQPVTARSGLRGYQPNGDDNDLVVPGTNWVSVIAPNSDVRPAARWDAYLAGLAT